MDRENEGKTKVLSTPYATAVGVALSCLGALLQVLLLERWCINVIGTLINPFDDISFAICVIGGNLPPWIVLSSRKRLRIEVMLALWVALNTCFAIVGLVLVYALCV